VAALLAASSDLQFQKWRLNDATAHYSEVHYTRQRKPGDAAVHTFNSDPLMRITLLSRNPQYSYATIDFTDPVALSDSLTV